MLVLHDAAPSHVKRWREVEADWTQEQLIMQMYKAQQAGNPPYGYMATPCWLQQGYNIIANCIAVDAQREAAAMAAKNG